MRVSLRVGSLMLVLLAMAGCSAIDSFGKDRPISGLGPKPEEMRKALLTMLNEQPDISIPEFKISLENDAPVTQGDIVHIGTWSCNSDLMTFEGLFSAPNITMYEVSGSFQLDARGIWRAIPRRVQKTQKRDIGEFWRPHEAEAP